MDQFAELIRLALYGAGRSKLKIGGIDFWFVKESLVYSHPSSTWNVEVIRGELIDLAHKGLNRASKAIS